MDLMNLIAYRQGDAKYTPKRPQVGVRVCRAPEDPGVSKELGGVTGAHLLAR
jgi:hypothetical protein